MTSIGRSRLTAPLRLMILAVAGLAIAATGCAAEPAAEQQEVSNESPVQGAWRHICQGRTISQDFTYSVFASVRTEPHTFLNCDVEKSDGDCIPFHPDFEAVGSAPSTLRVDVWSVAKKAKVASVVLDLKETGFRQPTEDVRSRLSAFVGYSQREGGNLYVELRAPVEGTLLTSTARFDISRLQTLPYSVKLYHDYKGGRKDESLCD